MAEGRAPRVMLALRVAPETVDALKVEARRAGVSRSVLARMLIEEGLRARSGPGVTTVPDDVASAAPQAGGLPVGVPVGGEVVSAAVRRVTTTARPPFAGPLPKGGRR